MGDKYASHFPYDGSVYIRPGNDGKGIMIGDMGAPYIQLRDSWFPNKVGDVIINPSTGGKVVIGQGTTAVNVEGTLGVANKLCLGDVCIDKNDLAKLKK
jgi:hypothetical protein